MNRIMLVVFLLAVAPITAQNQQITGVVKDISTQETLCGVAVILKDSKNNIKTYAISDQAGKFQIAVSTIAATDSLHFSMLGYEHLALSIANRNNVVALMRGKAFNLREVVVKAPRITMRRDTVSYNVASFLNAQDKTISDVLRKMHGIEVEKSGQIKYQGEAINKFYIDGMDMLGGNYTLATNNIAPENLKTVEVIENHQSTKALQDISFSDKAAINIKFKDDVKFKWIGTLKAALGGLPFLWNAHLFAMRIGKKQQSINNFKCNNSGENISADNHSFSLENIINSNAETYQLPNYIFVGSSSAPIAEHRTRFNHSCSFNSLNAWKLNDNYQLNVQGNYLFDQLQSDNTSKTIYYLENENITISENENAISRKHAASGKVELLANSEKFFLKEVLSAKMNWNEIKLQTAGTYPNLQKATTPDWSLDNDFQFVKRVGSHALTITSKNQYLSSSEKLSIHRENENPQQQTVDNSAFFSNLTASYGIKIKRWSLSFAGGYSYLNNNLLTELSGVNDFNVFDNHSRLKKSRVLLNPKLTFKKYSFQATINIPVSYYHYSFYDMNDSITTPNDLLAIAPALMMEYKITAKFKLFCSGRWAKQEIDDRQLYTGLIMSDYRHIHRGNLNFQSDQQANITGGFSFKNPINSLFFSGNVSQIWMKRATIEQQTFTQNYIISSMIVNSNKCNIFSAGFQASKGIDQIRGLVGFDIDYSLMETEMIRDFVPVPYITQTVNVAPRFNCKFARWGDLDYTFNYQYYIMSGKEGGILNQNHDVRQALSLNLIPIEKINIKLTGEHYFTRFSDGSKKHLFLADVAFHWNITEKIEVFTAITNIFNDTHYAYTLNGALSSAYCEYTIRPRNFMVGVYWRM